MKTEIIKSDNPALPTELWAFTPLDVSCLPMVINGTWIFDSQLDDTVLKSGLKKILNDYPHLAGRIDQDKGVRLSNDGVPFTVDDKPDQTLEDLYKDGDAADIFASKIGITKLKRGLEAPMQVKLTRFKDASVLAVSCAHACMDGDSFYKMVDNWGRICRQKDFDKPVVDQSLLPVPESVDRKKLMELALAGGWMKVSGLKFLIMVVPKFVAGVTKKRTRAFFFSSDALEGLRQEISNGEGHRVSRHVALSAFITRSCIKLLKHPADTPCMQLSVMNARQHLRGVPENFVGNASTMAKTEPFRADDSVDAIAGKIHQALMPMLETPSERLTQYFILSMNFTAAKLPIAPFDIFGLYAEKPTVFHINNFSKLPVYGVDFGAGIARSVIPHNLSDQILIWPAPPSRGGVEVYFSGTLAKRFKQLSATDPWLQEMAPYL